MKYEVRIHKLIDNGKPMKASASVVLDGMFAVHNVRVIQNEDRIFVAMPTESFTDKDGNAQRHDVFHPIHNEARKAFDAAVIAAYNEMKNAQA